MGVGSDITWDSYYRTKVFVPLSGSFFSNMKAHDVYDQLFKRTYQSDAAESAMSQSPTVSSKVDLSSISKNLSIQRFNEAYNAAISEKHGGRLATTDDLMKLIL